MTVSDTNMRQQTRISGRSRQSRVEREINKFNGGVNRLLEEARIGFNEAKEATNLMQVQDGLWKPRWGSDYFGATHAASIDGAAEYMASSGVTELITIANGKAWKSTNGGSLTEITGATFTAGIQCFFIQIGGYLYIANGTDSLARYNGSVLTTYSELSAPTGLNGTRTGLASGIYNLYAEVTALNAVGETVGSTEASLANGMSKPRDQWAASDSVTWAWNAVASATGYQLYISETAGNETLLASSTASTYRDDGTVALNP
jgi:hypothetical protein